MKKKICLIFLMIIILNMSSGCVFDENLMTKKEMEEYAQKSIAKDAVVESVVTDDRSNTWTLYLDRDPSKKFVVLEELTYSGGLPFRGRDIHSDFASVWIKELYDEYIANNSVFDDIRVDAGTGVYCENCGGFHFRIDCENREAQKNAINSFVSYVQDSGIDFQNDNSDFGYNITCVK